MEDYLEDGTVVQLWPPPDKLAEIAQDNTIFITTSTCSYSDLATNWVKHVWGLGIGCFFVAAADKPTANFFENWVPNHASQMPVQMAAKVDFCDSAASSEAYRKYFLSTEYAFNK